MAVNLLVGNTWAINSGSVSGSFADDTTDNGYDSQTDYGYDSASDANKPWKVLKKDKLARVKLSTTPANKSGDVFISNAKNESLKVTPANAVQGTGDAAIQTTVEVKASAKGTYTLKASLDGPTQPALATMGLKCYSEVTTTKKIKVLRIDEQRDDVVVAGRVKGTEGLAPTDRIIGPGNNGHLDSTKAVGDEFDAAGFIVAGQNGRADSDVAGSNLIAPEKLSKPALDEYLKKVFLKVLVPNWSAEVATVHLVIDYDTNSDGKLDMEEDTSTEYLAIRNNATVAKAISDYDCVIVEVNDSFDQMAVGETFLNCELVAVYGDAASAKRVAAHEICHGMFGIDGHGAPSADYLVHLEEQSEDKYCLTYAQWDMVNSQ